MVDRGSWTDRQGQVGDLRGQSRQQLQELLSRQEKILSNKHLLRTLPDKGKRIQEFSLRLRHAIDQHEEEERKQKLLSEAQEDLNFQYQQAFKAQQRTQQKAENVMEAAADDMKENSPALQSATLDSYELLPADAMETASASPMCELAEKLKLVNLQEDKSSVGSDDSKYSAGDNYGLKTESQKKPHFLSVFERTEKTAVSGKPKFKLNQFSQQSKNSSGSEGSSPLSVEARREQDKKHLDDMTSARLPPLHHSPAQLLSLEESAVLLKEQAKKQEELQAKQAAQKLSEGLKLSMRSYIPDGLTDAYREVHDEGAQLSSEED